MQASMQSSGMWSRLFRAEWRKVAGHRWATGCLIWIFPAMAVLIGVGGMLVMALSGEARSSIAEDPITWTSAALLPWAAAYNPLGKLILVGFAAVLFGGEYQWNTWKSVVPRTNRVPLILIKFATTGLFALMAFVVMSMVMVISLGLVSAVAGTSYGPTVNGDTVSRFIEDYAVQMFAGFAAVVITMSFAALAAMVTRSILGSVIVGVVVSFGTDFTFLPLVETLSNLTGTDFFLHLYRFTPGYNLVNLLEWLLYHQGVIDEHPAYEFPSGTVVDSEMFNVVLLAIWIVGLVSLTAYLFQRQDITN